MLEAEAELDSFESFVDVDDVNVVVDVGIVSFEAFTFLTEFLRLHPMTVDVMTETTMMQRKEMNSRPEVLVSVTQMDGHSPEAD